MVKGKYYHRIPILSKEHRPYDCCTGTPPLCRYTQMFSLAVHVHVHRYLRRACPYLPNFNVSLKHSRQCHWVNAARAPSLPRACSCCSHLTRQCQVLAMCTLTPPCHSLCSRTCLSANPLPNAPAPINRRPGQYQPTRTPFQTPPMNHTSSLKSSTPQPQPELLLLAPTDPAERPPGWGTWFRRKRKHNKERRKI